jgi:hypothetical protein
MTQNPLINSGTKSSQKSALKPELAIALGSLEVQLEQELTRYRRARSGVRQAKKSSLETYIPDPPQPSSSTTGTLGKTQQSVAEVPKKFVLPENPEQETENKPEINQVLESSSIQESTTTTTPPSPAMANSMSSIVPTKVKTTESEILLQTNSDPKPPDDYLESSEALLRSLQAEQPSTKKSSSSNDSLLSPLGIGSLLLLLLASLTLGYVVFNPQTLPQLDLSKFKLFNFGSPSNAENSQVTQSNTAPVVQPEITPIPKYPNLAIREFPEVKDPNDVVGLTPKEKPTPKATTTHKAIATPINPIPAPTALPQVSAIPQPQKTLPGLNTTVQPSADNYYLIVDNQGDGALAKVQQVVPDAYLSPNKKYIYLGALKTEAEAKQKLQQLKAKGIQARLQEQ